MTSLGSELHSRRAFLDFMPAKMMVLILRTARN